MADLICKSCGSTKGVKRNMKGSLLIEIILWLAFLIPGLIYSVWRHTTVAKVCKACKSEELVPTDSPIGKKLLSELSEGREAS